MDFYLLWKIHLWMDGFSSHHGRSSWLFQYKVMVAWLGWFGVPSWLRTSPFSIHIVWIWGISKSKYLNKGNQGHQIWRGTLFQNPTHIAGNYCVAVSWLNDAEWIFVCHRFCRRHCHKINAYRCVHNVHAYNMSLHTLYFMMNRDVVGRAFSMDTVDFQAESWRCKQQYD